MASQPLETIPKDPTPAPTFVRVTADPPKTQPAKDPARVARGKKLAERHRQAWAALKKAEAEAEAARKAEAEARKAEEEAEAEAASKAEAEARKAEAEAASPASGSSNLSLVAVLGIGGLIVSLLGLYYQREAIVVRVKPAPPTQPAPAPTPAPSRLPVKRGLKKMV